MSPLQDIEDNLAPMWSVGHFHLTENSCPAALFSLAGICSVELFVQAQGLS
jgi:hypothetical protein